MGRPNTKPPGRGAAKKWRRAWCNPPRSPDTPGSRLIWRHRDALEIPGFCMPDLALKIWILNYLQLLLPRRRFSWLRNFFLSRFSLAEIFFALVVFSNRIAVYDVVVVFRLRYPKRALDFGYGQKWEIKKKNAKIPCMNPMVLTRAPKDHLYFFRGIKIESLCDHFRCIRRWF